MICLTVGEYLQWVSTPRGYMRAWPSLGNSTINPTDTTKPYKAKNLSMEEVIIKCQDFKEAVNDSALAEVEGTAPKYHCECSAIEYCWGW